ncbi:MAG: hypothetical protein HKO87_04405 [Acidimicrobiia bacterium]|nr:hypothetical protein [Acidimicrobiia bacterium]
MTQSAAYTSSSSAIEQLGSFPPVTGADWRNMFLGQPTPINPDAAQMVYDISWFLVKDVAAATEISVITFRVALSRLHDLPEPAAYTAWLGVIATNEAHRYLEEAPTRRLSSALIPTGAERDALFLADTLADMRADQKLAMLLRYRYNTPPGIITMALDMRPRRLARLFVKAREEFAQNSSLPPAMLAAAQPPRTKQLPRSVEAYSKKELRPSVLGYPWLASGFPALPEREERRAKWLTAVATIVLLVILALVVTRPWSAERPELIDPDASAPPLVIDPVDA